ncbi:MAG TPA: hypothetical protein VIY73_00560 [Polyangiaceae bacterium]
MPAVPVVCRKLRTKTAFGTLEGLTRDWREGASSTAVFWCLRTMETWGVDQQPAHASGCRRGRTCFAAPDGANGPNGGSGANGDEIA